MTSGPTSATEQNIPALSYSRRPLLDRARYDFTDYGFTIAASLSQVFETIPMEVSDQEAFLFFYPKDDLAIGRFSLFNFHCFLKYTGSIEDFAHSRGASVQNIALDDTTFNGVTAKIYHRTISMKELFEGAPQVIDLIGGRPDMVVADSHLYFIHRHAHFYSGMIHEPGDDDRYEALRSLLIAGITLVG
jgi:hypothetical protein